MTEATPIAVPPQAPTRPTPSRSEVAPDEEPHVRLGLLWAGIAVSVTWGGTWWLAAWMAIAAGLAGVQVSRSWRTASARGPQALLAGAGAAAIALAAAGGGGVLVLMAAIVTLAVVAVGVGADAVRTARHIRRSSGHLRTAAIALAVGAAASGPVLARHRSLAEGMVLLALWSCYDAAAYLIGTGATSSWEGPAAGVATIAALSLGVAAVLDPPFHGAAPWILGGVAALLAPFGPPVASRLLRDAEGRAPALRRLDALLLLGPAWGLAAGQVLHHP